MQHGVHAQRAGGTRGAGGTHSVGRGWLGPMLGSAPVHVRIDLCACCATPSPLQVLGLCDVRAVRATARVQRFQPGQCCPHTAGDLHAHSCACRHACVMRFSHIHTHRHGLAFRHASGGVPTPGWDLHGHACFTRSHAHMVVRSNMQASSTVKTHMLPHTSMLVHAHASAPSF